jgi:hypothetical protein
MAEVQWYYARDDKPMGPVSPAELKQLADSGALKPDDLLWREGMDAWTTAINLQGLFSEAASLAPRALASTPRIRRPGQLGHPAGRPNAHARLRSLVFATQVILWTTCVLVVVVGIVLFTRAFMLAADANQEAAAGLVFATFFLGAYVLARCGEKLSRLLLAYARRRP